LVPLINRNGCIHLGDSQFHGSSKCIRIWASLTLCNRISSLGCIPQNLFSFPPSTPFSAQFLPLILHIDPIHTQHHVTTSTMSPIKSAASRSLRSKLLAQNPRLFNKAKRSVGLAATGRNEPNSPMPFHAPGKLNQPFHDSIPCLLPFRFP